MLDCEVSPMLNSVAFEDFVLTFKRNGSLIDPKQWAGTSPARADVQNLQLGQKAIVRLLYRLLHQYQVEEELGDQA